jgi:sigma-B regulation protein RsbU (phosphoserine phosphatase)
MRNEMSGTTNTVRFLQEENQRLQQQAAELQEANSYLRECLKSIRGLQWAVERLGTQVELQGLLDRIMYEALRMVDAEDGSLSLVDEESKELVWVVVRGVLQEKLQGYRMSLEQGVGGWVATHQEPVVVNDITQDDRFSPEVDRLFHFRTRSLTCVPLVSRGKVLGVIEVVNKFSGRPFDDRDVEMLTMLAPIAATAIDLASREEVK